MHDAVVRLDEQARVVEGDEAGQDEVRAVPRFAAIDEGGLVAVVSVRDVQLLLSERSGDGVHGGRVLHEPERVLLSVRGELSGGRARGGLGEGSRKHTCGVAVEHEDGAEVGVGRAHEREPVLLGAGGGVLVRKHAVAQFLQAERAEQTMTLPLHAARRKALAQQVVGRSIVAGEHAVAQHGAKGVGGVLVAFRRRRPFQLR